MNKFFRSLFLYFLKEFFYSMNIHSLFILKTTGNCLYSRNFTKNFKNIKVDLIAPFISAIFSFSEKAVSRRLEILEMNDLRFKFKVQQDFIFVLIADLSTSIRFLSACLDRITSVFFEYYDRLGKLKEFEVIKDFNLDKSFDMIIMGFEKIDLDLYNKMNRLFQYLILNNEIIGATVLLTSGQVIYSSLSNELLLASLKELEIRFMTGIIEYPVMLNYHCLKAIVS